MARGESGENLRLRSVSSWRCCSRASVSGNFAGSCRPAGDPAQPVAAAPAPPLRQRQRSRCDERPQPGRAGAAPVRGRVRAACRPRRWTCWRAVADEARAHERRHGRDHRASIRRARTRRGHLATRRVRGGAPWRRGQRRAAAQLRAGVAVAPRRATRPRGRSRRARGALTEITGRLPMTTALGIDPLALADHGPVIPVIVIARRSTHAVPLARALVEGGVRVLEVTLRTPVALRAIEAIARAVPEAIVGAGTVRSARRRAGRARRRRALRRQPRLHAARSARPVASSASRCCPASRRRARCMPARDGGFRFLKFFPADAGRRRADAEGAGRAVRRRAVLPDRRHRRRVGAASTSRWRTSRVVGGSWLTPPERVARGDWPRITQLARDAARAARLSRSAAQAVALDQLDLVAVRIGDEGDHRGAALDRARLARDVAAAGADLLARGVDVGHAERDVAVGGAELVADRRRSCRSARSRHAPGCVP